ncbi:hydrosulfide channel (FNT family) [Alkalibaculum bacchi]|uniref:Hydrosulfide channel (FNT family) n=1 Tax=Alkalibaculum bacchi TaxID=645887 RepID=A0A366IFA6_9FIRM|nr:formate/nitrite transporter family protein [Alkalibaculum bacchi]RBP70062.1 hydrosulfide channel (FNT family) [Alkalibaculum bacchi]
MYEEDLKLVSKAAKAKVSFMKGNLLGYFIASMLGGAYVGFGVLLIHSIGGMLQGGPYTKIIMGVSFSIALSLVVIAGAELFTGNNFVIGTGALMGTVSWKDTIKVWIVCYLGNWAGSIVLAILSWGAGISTGPIGEFVAAMSATKMSIPLISLLLKGVLCNILVCLAIWSSTRCKSESGKLIMIFLCLFAFITSGFEHSIANMTLLTIGLLAPHGTAISLGGYLYNIGVVTIGNMIGGILFLAIPYYIIAGKKVGKALEQ